MFSQFIIIYILLLASLLPYSNALIDYYSLNNNKVLQTCAYVSNSEDSIQKWFRNNDPYIKIHFPTIENLEKKIEVYTLIMGGDDMKKVTIGLNPYYKICDELALSNKFCEHETDEIHLKKNSLADLINLNSFNYPIESFMLSTLDENDHIYQLDKSGIYCIMFLTSEIPENLESLNIEVDWIQSYGKLLISDFSRMFSSVIFSIIYFLIAIILSILIYKKIQIDDKKTSITIDNLKFKKYTLQFKFILFYWCYGIVYLSNALNYLTLNKFGYSTISIFVPLTNLISLISSTLITIWLIYNLMLFSAGAWFDNGFKNSNYKLNLIKLICIILIFEMLLYDIETSSIYSLIGDTPTDFLSTIIYIEYLFIFILSFIWAIITSFTINDKKLKSIYFITIGLLTLLFSTIIFGAYIFSETAYSATIAYSVEFIFTLVLTMLWYNVVLENNQFTLSI
jgi:hypothetical protein